jgi:hypothetical protein
MAKSGKKASTKRKRAQGRVVARFVIWPDPNAAAHARGSESTGISAASGAVIANTSVSMHVALKRLADK